MAERSRRGRRPECYGMYGLGEECQSCPWRRECMEATERIIAAATRKGTHVRVVSKYKERKFKPRRIP